MAASDKLHQSCSQSWPSPAGPESGLVAQSCRTGQDWGCPRGSCSHPYCPSIDALQLLCVQLIGCLQPPSWGTACSSLEVGAVLLLCASPDSPACTPRAVACNLASSISPAPAHPRLPALAGYGGGGAACGDLWALHLEGPASFCWEELSPSGPAPAPRFDHTAVALPTAPNSQQPAAR